METTPTRIVWLTLIAAMDEHGIVHFASIANLAHRAIVSIEEAQKAVECLESPDPNSADPEHDGRRIERIEGGWLVLNSHKYRALVTRAIIQEQTRKRVAKHRAKKFSLNSQSSVTQCNENVTPSEAVSKANNKYISSGKIQKKLSPEHKEIKKIAIEALEFLNSKTGRNFRLVDANLKPIISILKTGVSLSDLKKVIEIKCLQWIDDEKMAGYLRPITLFNKTNFEQYFGEATKNNVKSSIVKQTFFNHEKISDEEILENRKKSAELARGVLLKIGKMETC